MLSLSVLAVYAVLAAPPVGVNAEWPFDELILTNGGRFRGLLLEESVRGIRFQTVRRAAGRPTVTLTLFFNRDEVARIVRLSEEDRQRLKQKLGGLDPHGAGERKRMEELTLAPADWFGRPNAAFTYESDQFTLISGASEEVTRRATVRLEQIYTAFARLLPPRFPAARKTTVYLAGSPEEYRKLLGPTAGPLLNPAVYDPIGNRIVCGSDLRRLGEELTATRLGHQQQLAGIDRYEENIRTAYKGQKAELDRFHELAQRERRRIWAAERANDRAFDQATRRLFALLYHEAFHSYTGTFVYPPRAAGSASSGAASSGSSPMNPATGELPRWLNEGLAQIFETAVVDAGELRVGHADAVRLDRVQDRLSGKTPGGLLSVSELLRAGPDTYLAAHGSTEADAIRAYLSSWAVAFHLTFDRRVVGTRAFDEYLVQLNSGRDPVAAFEKLVDQPLPAYEVDLRDYLTRLLPDGSLRPKP